MGLMSGAAVTIEAGVTLITVVRAAEYRVGRGRAADHQAGSGQQKKRQDKRTTHENLPGLGGKPLHSTSGLTLSTW